MARTTTSIETDLLGTVSIAVHLLNRTPALKDAIDNSLLLLAEQFPDQTFLFLQLSPGPREDQPMVFQRFLEIQPDKVKREHNFPLAFQQKGYSQDDIQLWLRYLQQRPSTTTHYFDVPGLTQGEKSILGFTGTIFDLEEERYNYAWQSLAESIGLHFISYTIFSLEVQEQSWGMLILLSPEEEPPWINEQLLVLSTYTTTLANLLARQDAEWRLREQRDYLRRSIDLNPGLIWAQKREGAIRLVNQAQADFLGKSVEEIEGSTLADILGDPELLAGVQEMEQQVIREKRAVQTSPQLHHDCHGNPLWLQTTLTPVENPESGEIEETIGVSVDITELKKIQDKLEEERAIKDLITASVPDYIFLIDLTSSLVIYRNVDNYLGRPISDDYSLSTLLQLLPFESEEQTAEQIGELATELQQHGVVERKYALRHQDGHQVWVSLRITVFKQDKNGDIQQVLAIVRDTTEQRNAMLTIQANETRYRNFIKHSIEGIYYMACEPPIDTSLPMKKQVKHYYDHAYVEECNQSMAKMYGLESPSQLIGQKIRKLHAGPSYEFNQKSFVQFIENNYRVEDVETHEMDQQGRMHYFVNRAVGVVENGFLVGIWGVQQDVTSKRRTEKALAESELKLSSVIRDTKVGIWEWYLSRGLFIVNQNCLDMLGYGPSSSKLKEEEFWQIVHPDDQSLLHDAVQSHLQQKDNFYQVDVRLKHKSGEVRWIQIHGRLAETSKDGSPMRISGSMINIHEKKQADLLIKESESLLKATLNTLPDIKIRVNQEGKVLSVYSPSQERTMLKLLPEEMVDQPLTKCLPTYVAKGILHNMELARQTEEVQRIEFPSSTANDVHHFEARINAINAEEAMVVLRNISALKDVEKKLSEKVNELDLKNRELQTYIESNLQLENFAYVASHDLREPVRTMRTFAQILDRHLGASLDEDSRSYLDFIINGANQMNQLIEDLLAYSRVNTDPMEIEPIAIHELLDEIESGLDSSIKDAKATIERYHLPEHIHGSQIRIKQLFQNLIANGIKFRKSVIEPVIEISSKETSTHWQFAIRDNGIGIRPEFFEQIFKLFKKLHPRNEYQGTGIGLALCQKIVDQHHGEIWLESQLGKGTTFFFTIRKE